MPSFMSSAASTAIVVPMKAIFVDHLPCGLIGHNLILEHVHPNVDGYFLMADAFFSTMRQDILSQVPGIPS